MKLEDIFPSASNYLKKEDLPRPVKVIIEDVDAAEFTAKDGTPQHKLDITLKGKEKHFLCNKTNARMIATIIGSSDTKDWNGKEITIFNDPTVMMGDDVVGGIRVQYIPPASDDLDDDIPF